MLHRRRRSGPASTSTLAIAPSLAPVQTPVFALVLTSPINSEIARRSSAEGYVAVPEAGQRDQTRSRVRTRRDRSLEPRSIRRVRTRRHPTARREGVSLHGGGR